MSEVPPNPVLTTVLVLRVNVEQLMGDTIADALRDEFLARYEQSGAQHAILDMEKVKYLSSAGLRPLLGLNKKVHEREGRLILTCLNKDVEGVLLATRLISTSRQRPASFESHPDVPSSVAALYLKADAGA